MKIQTNLIKNARVRERVETACAAAEKMGRTFVAATFRVIAEQELVKITIPSVTAKYLKKVDAHKLLVFTDEKLLDVLPIDIAEHSIHGDFPVKRADNTQRPRVVRHFYVLPGYYGETIAAYVTLKEKTDLITGEKTIMVDIQQEFFEKPLNTEEPLYAARKLCMGVPATGAVGEAVIPGMVDIQQEFSEKPLTLYAAHKLCMGVPATGAAGEAAIPGNDGLCIRFEPIHPFAIEPQNSDINMMPSNNAAAEATDNTTPSEAKTESVAA